MSRSNFSLRKFNYKPTLTPERLKHLQYMQANPSARLIENNYVGWSIVNWADDVPTPERYVEVEAPCSYVRPLRWDTAWALEMFMTEVDPKYHTFERMFQLNSEAEFTQEWLDAELKRRADKRQASYDGFAQANEAKAERVKAQLWDFIQASGASYNDIVLVTDRYSPELGGPEQGLFVQVTLGGLKYRVHVEATQ